MSDMPLEGYSLAYTGSFHLGRSKLVKALRAMGAKLSKEPNSRTDLYLAGDMPMESKVERAKMLGIPIIDAAAVKQLCEGASLASLLASLGEEEADPGQELGEALEEVREILAGGPGSHTWKAIHDLLERTEANEQEALVDYILPHLDSWPEERWSGKQPKAWNKGLLSGESVPKYRLIRTLSLPAMDLTSKSAVPLFAASSYDALREVELQSNKLSSPFFKAWKKSGKWDALDSLMLNRNKLNNASLKALFDVPQLGSLRYLYLRGVGLTEETCEQLLAAKQLDKLVGLELDDNEIPSKNLHTIATSPRFAELRFLSLKLTKHMGQGDGIQALLSSPLAAQLTGLDLSQNSKAGALVDALAESRQFEALEVLRLGGVGLDDNDLRRILSNPSLSSLQELRVPENALSNDGIAAILDAPFAGQLKVLSFTRCQHSEDVVQLLKEATHLSRLETLGLSSFLVPHDSVEHAFQDTAHLKEVKLLEPWLPAYWSLF